VALRYHYFFKKFKEPVNKPGGNPLVAMMKKTGVFSPAETVGDVRSMLTMLDLEFSSLASFSDVKGVLLETIDKCPPRMVAARVYDLGSVYFFCFLSLANLCIEMIESGFFHSKAGVFNESGQGMDVVDIFSICATELRDGGYVTDSEFEVLSAKMVAAIDKFFG
jgi:hypothetical protein